MIPHKPLWVFRKFNICVFPFEIRGSTFISRLSLTVFARKCLGFCKLRLCDISASTFFVAVAVNAQIGVFGKNLFNLSRFLYSALNSCPQALTQWASSITK